MRRGSSRQVHMDASTFGPETLSTMGELASAPAFLLIGNDATDQNPLVAWQIRSAIRHHGARLYARSIRADPKLARKAKLYLEVPPGGEGRRALRAGRWDRLRLQPVRPMNELRALRDALEWRE